MCNRLYCDFECNGKHHRAEYNVVCSFLMQECQNLLLSFVIFCYLLCKCVYKILYLIKDIFGILTGCWHVRTKAGLGVELSYQVTVYGVIIIRDVGGKC